MSKPQKKITDFIIEDDNLSDLTDEDNNELFFDVKKKTDIQHILDAPDTYIGSVETVDSDMWIMNDAGTEIIKKNINYIPGLFKLFDEGIVNCRDHVIRMNKKIQENSPNSVPVSFIDIAIQPDGTITMINDGNGIDIVKHPEYDVYVPELIFGHLRTSTNYNKEEKKIVGGKNGFGFKLVLIWSTEGSIETIDHIRGLKYTQQFKNNLTEICLPKITNASKTKPYTKVQFKPDYARLGINGLSEDMINLLKKRVYDISAVTDKTIKVKYNSSVISTKNFEQYINLYIGDKSKAPRAYESCGERWEYAVALTPSDGFVQVSFVNGISTTKGGKHVDYVLAQIVKKLTEYIEKKKKIKVNSGSIKEQLILFLRCDIENPAFDSQTKDYMNTPSSKFGSKCEVSDKFIEKIAKLGVMDQACAFTEVKVCKAAAKKTTGTRSKSVKGLPKLVDANWAGTDESHLCMLLLCEGDSAKTAIISGLSSSDRNTIGVYPLKGKVMNVRDKNMMSISNNKEILEISKALGLELGKEYETIDDVYKNLRYGKVVFITDQDLDGAHIKGLGINLFHCEWNSLTKINGFIGFMNTPILKAEKGDQVLSFYNKGEYDAWKREINDTKGWKIKYYKGLGTSSKAEFKQYMKDKKFVWMKYVNESCDNSIDLVFNKKRSHDRKDWLENVYDRESYADTSQNEVTYTDFINKEFIHFSKYDCERSIPNMIDGLKTSLRKIMYTAFKRNLTSEIKVAQFSGSVSEMSGYHHGEESLNKAIVGLAQNFVGSNNINLLHPAGQFGSRIQGGADASSPRYIFVRLEKIARLIFPKEDDPVLKYLNDDGTLVEPQYYVPIIPMILINGSVGIGTGFSNENLPYNPKTVIQYLKCKLRGEETKDIEFIPYYEGFKGTIEKLSETKFMTRGSYVKIDEKTIRVTELPVGFWIDSFKELIDKLESDKDKDGNKIAPIIIDKKENSTDNRVDFTLTFNADKLAELEAGNGEHGCNKLEKVLNLYNTVSTSNMHLFDSDDKLKRYESVDEIIDEYYDIRLGYYQDRKDHMIEILESELQLLSNKVKYIKDVLEGEIDLRGLDDEEISTLLEEKGLDDIDDNGYAYLVKMPMNSVSSKNVAKLNSQRDAKEAELEELRRRSLESMWLSELEMLEIEYEEYLRERELMLQDDNTSSDDEDDSEIKPKSKKVVKKVVKSKIVTKSKSELHKKSK